MLTQAQPNPDHFLLKRDPHIRRSEAFPLGLRTWVAVQALHTQPLSLFSVLTHSLVTWIWNSLAISVPRVMETRQRSRGRGWLRRRAGLLTALFLVGLALATATATVHLASKVLGAALAVQPLSHTPNTRQTEGRYTDAVDSIQTTIIGR